MMMQRDMLQMEQLPVVFLIPMEDTCVNIIIRVDIITVIIVIIIIITTATIEAAVVPL
jgi:hypothetical protein